MQPLGALSDHLTKLQLQKNLSLYQNLLSNTCIAWSCQVSVSSDNTAVLTVVFFRDGRRSRQCPRVALLLVLAHLFLHRTSAWHLAGVGDELVEVRLPVSDGSSALCGCQRGAALDGAVQRRPSHQRPPRGHPLTRARCRSVVVNW